jgi:ABC-type polysaccharide transport system permease subunit
VREAAKRRISELLLKSAKSAGRRHLALPLLVYAFLYIPLAVVVLFSFNDSMLNAEWVGFTMRWYAKLMHDEDMLRAAANSLLIAWCPAPSPPCWAPWRGSPCTATGRAGCPSWC